MGEKKSPVCFPRFHGDTVREYGALWPGLISREGVPLTTDRSVTTWVHVFSRTRSTNTEEGGNEWYWRHAWTNIHSNRCSLTCKWVKMHTDAKKHDQSQDFTVYIYWSSEDQPYWFKQPSFSALNPFHQQVHSVFQHLPMDRHTMLCRQSWWLEDGPNWLRWPPNS